MLPRTTLALNRLAHPPSLSLPSVVRTKSCGPEFDQSGKRPRSLKTFPPSKSSSSRSRTIRFGQSTGKDLGNFTGFAHSRITAHFHAARTGYSTTTYDPIAAFLPSRLFTWIPQVAKYWFHKKHAFRDYTTHGKGTGIYPIDDRVKISIAGDWGTGTDEARIVAAAMETSDPAFTIHLGDVYYVGDANE